MDKIVEYSFALPIFYFFDEEEENLSEEIKKVSELLDISIDVELIINKYNSYEVGEGDVLVFLPKNKFDTFMVMDLYNGITDQSNMVNFGLRCGNQNIKEILRSLHNRSIPTSVFIESNGNELLNQINKDFYPKIIRDGGVNYYQHLEYYVNSHQVFNSREANEHEQN